MCWAGAPKPAHSPFFSFQPVSPPETYSAHFLASNSRAEATEGQVSSFINTSYRSSQTRDSTGALHPRIQCCRQLELGGDRMPSTGRREDPRYRKKWQSLKTVRNSPQKWRSRGNVWVHMDSFPLGGLTDYTRYSRFSRFSSSRKPSFPDYQGPHCRSTDLSSTTLLGLLLVQVYPRAIPAPSPHWAAPQTCQHLLKKPSSRVSPHRHRWGPDPPAPPQPPLGPPPKASPSPTSAATWSSPDPIQSQ